MTGKDEEARRPVDRLADALAESIFNMSDKEVLAEFGEDGGDSDRHAADMRALFEKVLLAANKARMASAKAGAAANRRATREPSVRTVDIADARARLRAVIERASATSGLTLAARKEEELSDADVLGMLEELAELGLLDDEPEAGKS